MPSRELDLDAYLSRIGVRSPQPPTLDFLHEIIARHTAAIPFENLDIILGRPIRLDIGSIQAKLVDSSRGGYCFEQNTLLRAALERLGFTVRSLMARVVRGAPADSIPPMTHMLLRVDLPGGSYLADVGFGNLTPTAPLRLDVAGSQPTEHEDYRFQPGEAHTLLQVRLGPEWEDVYRFSDAATHPIDHEVGNWFTSTKPDGLFTANVIAARPGRTCRTTLFNGKVTTRTMDMRVQHEMPQTEHALFVTLRDNFGIGLGNDELATVQAAIARFTERPEAGFGLD